MLNTPHSRRARPTLRLIREDLTSGWENPHFIRALADGNTEALHPLSDLPHPIIHKSAESFGESSADDIHEGRIKAARDQVFLEVKVGQWRGAVWIDEDGVCWLVAAPDTSTALVH